MSGFVREHKELILVLASALSLAYTAGKKPGVAAPLINEGVCQNIRAREGLLSQYIYSN
jgi:hypothetical protein